MSKRSAARRVRQTRRPWQEGVRNDWRELAAELGAQRVRRRVTRASDGEDRLPYSRDPGGGVTTWP